MGLKPRYEVIHDGNWLTLRDLGPWDIHFTITNSPESVLAEIDPQGRPVFYFDSEGKFTRLWYPGERFPKSDSK